MIASQWTRDEKQEKDNRELACYDVEVVAAIRDGTLDSDPP